MCAPTIHPFVQWHLEHDPPPLRTRDTVKPHDSMYSSLLVESINNEHKKTHCLYKINNILLRRFRPQGLRSHGPQPCRLTMLVYRSESPLQTGTLPLFCYQHRERDRSLTVLLQR